METRPQHSYTRVLVRVEPAKRSIDLQLTTYEPSLVQLHGGYHTWQSCVVAPTQSGAAVQLLVDVFLAEKSYVAADAVAAAACARRLVHRPFLRPLWFAVRSL